MIPQDIDYDDLKKRGFLRQKQEGLFVLRTRISAKGVYTKKQLEELARISEKYGRGFAHPTVRQGLEIPFIKFEDIPEVEKELRNSGILTGTSGPRLRTTTCCPGNNWCKSGLIDTFALAERIENELNIKCGMSLAHKFKIAISGCPNTCTRVQNSEIGIHGQVDLSSSDKRIGYTVYMGGCGGRTPRAGFKLEGIFSEDQVLSLVERVVAFFKNRAKPKQRLALLIEETGKDEFLKEILTERQVRQ
jgi:dissimilatory sulfite reductase (desulfoviridin) alpha/beta subunit